MPSDAQLIQITTAALHSAYARAVDWMACRAGCHQCCIGVFPINVLDAARLREGLRTADPATAHRILERAVASRRRLTSAFPGDPDTGILFTAEHHEESFEDFANDEVCPVLDPATGTCDLYEARPMTCRTFGPPMPNDEGGIGVCELCFVGAPAGEIARCTVDATFLDIEAELLKANGDESLTLIAFALTQEPDAFHPDREAE